MPEQNDFLYDDFFSSPDASPIPATIEVRGRKLSIGLRMMGFGELQALMSKSLRITLDEAGKPQVEVVNESEGNTDLILACLRSWPFKNRDGSMVPITKETLAQMHPDVMVALLQRVSDFMEKSLKMQQEGIQGPFGKP